MSLVKFERIVSVSSEDPAFPADNLLKSDYSDKKWKCKSPGEKQLSVVIQMNSAVVINAVDIGNYGSAFIEVFVGKSSNPDEFKVLVVASSLMTLQEAKLGENMTNVRFFKENCLVKPVASEKWDRIKFVCSQPYNKFVQYGLSFVVVHSKNVGTSENSVPTLGKFVLKPKDDTDNIATGSLFAKRKEKTNENKVAAAIRAASTSGIIFPKKNSKLTPSNTSSDQEDRDVKEKTTENKNSIQANHFSPVLRKDSLKKQKIVGTKAPKGKPNSGCNGSPAQGSSPLLGAQPSKQSADHRKPESKKKIIPNQRPEKPFNQLMDGVVFTISGFQNPYRSDLRSKAIAMGAKYRPDWDNSCTHLLCAFPNTPKFNQVLGQGKIITKEWIESCYLRRMRLPWRRFALHRPDKNLPESEEEIYEYVPRSPSPVDNRRRLSPGPLSSGEDTEEEIERVRMLQIKKQKDDSQENISSKKDSNNFRNCLLNENDEPDNSNIQPIGDQKSLKEPVDSEASFPLKKMTKKTFQKNKLKESKDAYPNKKQKFDVTEDLKIDEENMSEEIKPMELSTLSNSNDKPGPSWRFRDIDIYEIDTDVEPEESDSKQYNLPLLVVFYEGIQFFICRDISIEERKKLERYIIAHKGTITDKESREVEFIISRSASEVELVKRLCPIAIGVRPDWIWMCHDRNYLPPPSRFEIK